MVRCERDHPLRILSLRLAIARNNRVYNQPHPSGNGTDECTRPQAVGYPDAKKANDSTNASANCAGDEDEDEKLEQVQGNDDRENT